MKSKNSSYLNYRGGFSLPSGRKTNPFETNVPADKFGIDKIKKSVAKDTTPSNALGKAKKLADMASNLGNTRVGGIVLTIVTNGIVSALNNSKRNLPAYYQNSLIKSNTTEDLTRTHILRFHVGMQSTVSVLQAEKQHGSVTMELNNSIADSTDLESRKFLTRSFGFNMKSFDFLNENFYGTVKDYDNIYNIASWKLPEHGNQVPYGLVKSQYSNLKIRNSNSYHKMKVKIHVVKILDDDKTMHGIYKDTFNDIGLKFKLEQKPGAIPVVYQLSRENNDATRVNKFMNSTLCYLGASVKMSASFKTQAEIIKTFSKELNPGDTLDFRMTHHCGPGLRFDIAQVYLNNGGKGLQPSGYSLIVETEGTECEAVRLVDGAVFQGTSPGWYNFEFKKGITLVRNSTIISKAGELSSTIENRYAVKVHERKFIESRPFTIDSAKIGAPGVPDKEYMIVSLSNERRVYAQAATIVKEEPKPVKFKILENDFDSYDESEEMIGEEYEDA